MADNTGSLLIVSSNIRTSLELDAKDAKKKRPKSAPRRPRCYTDQLPSDSLCNPRNYLIRGGARHFELRLEQMNKAAIQDLRAANEALAAEYVRHKNSSDLERASLKDQAASLASDLRAEQERLRLTSERLAEESKARSEAEALHHTRLKEITKRLRDEHNARTAAEAELNTLKQQMPGLEAASAATGELRGSVARLEAIVSGDAAVITDLRARLSATEAKLEAEQENRGDLIARQRSAEAQASQASARASELARSLSEAEAKAKLLQARLAAVQDDHEALKQALQNEREAHASLRERCGVLQSDLTELQATSTVAATQATANRGDLERARRELVELSAREAASSDTIATLREEVLHLRAENAGLRTTIDSLRAEVTDAKLEVATRASEIAAKTNEVEVLSAKLATVSYQAENHARIFEENEALVARLEKTESSLRQKEAVLTEAVSSHAAQLEMWRAEATEVAQAASKWKQRAMMQQQQLEAREREASTRSDDLRELTARCSSAEAERGRLTEAVASLEGRLSSAQQEATTLRSQLQESLAAQAAAARQAESASHDAAQKEAAADRLTARLAEETARTTSLRNDVAALTQQQVRELDTKARVISDLTLALQKEERARGVAQGEAASLKAHLSTLERELRTAQVALASITDDKARAEEAYEAAEGALKAAQRRARNYKRESKAVLSEYDTYLGSLMQQQQQATPPPPSTLVPPSTQVAHTLPATCHSYPHPDLGYAGGNSGGGAMFQPPPQHHQQLHQPQHQQQQHQQLPPAPGMTAPFTRGSLSFGAMLPGQGGGSRPGTATGAYPTHHPTPCAVPPSPAVASSAGGTFGGAGWVQVRGSGEAARWGNSERGVGGEGGRWGSSVRSVMDEEEDARSDSMGSTTLERLTALLDSNQL